MSRKKLFFTIGLLLCTSHLSISHGAALQVPSLRIKTISDAILRSKPGDTIWVGNGIYKEKIVLAPNIVLMARSLFKAVIDGGGKGTAVTLSKNSTISGFTITNSTIGILSNGVDNSIVSCRIVSNWQTGIIVVRHLPRIEDNIIAFNRGSGIQGWDVRSTKASIKHNTVAYNGNHGIALGGNSEVIIEKNIIAFNDKFGLKVSENLKQIQIDDNNFFSNLPVGYTMPQGNFSFNPMFISPRKSYNFRSDPSISSKYKSNDNEEFGARILHNIY